MNPNHALFPILALFLLGPSCPSDQTPTYDYDNDGYSDEVDCDSQDPLTHPGATEVCDDTKDNDCDGLVDAADNDCPGSDDDDDDDDDDTLSHDDMDGDSFSPADGDCDDGDPAVHPGATEVCDEVDNDCDGWINDTATVDIWETNNDNATYHGDLTYGQFTAYPFAGWPGDVDRYEFEVTDLPDDATDEFEIHVTAFQSFKTVDLEVQIISVTSLNGSEVTLVSVDDGGFGFQEEATFHGSAGLDDSGRYRIVVSAVDGYDCDVAYWLTLTPQG